MGAAFAMDRTAGSRAVCSDACFTDMQRVLPALEAYGEVAMLPEAPTGRDFSVEMVNVQAAAVQDGVGEVVRRHILDAVFPVKGAQILQEVLLRGACGLTPPGCCQRVGWQIPILASTPLWDGCNSC